MRSGYLWLASLAAFPLVGTPLLAHPSFRRFGVACRFVLAAGVGMVLLSGTMTVWALAGWRWGPILLLVSAAVAFALRGLIPKGSDPAPLATQREIGAEGRSTPAIALSRTVGSLFSPSTETELQQSARDDYDS